MIPIYFSSFHHFSTHFYLANKTIRAACIAMCLLPVVLSAFGVRKYNSILDKTGSQRSTNNKNSHNEEHIKTGCGWKLF